MTDYYDDFDGDGFFGTDEFSDYRDAAVRIVLDAKRIRIADLHRCLELEGIPRNHEWTLNALRSSDLVEEVMFTHRLEYQRKEWALRVVRNTSTTSLAGEVIREAVKEIVREVMNEPA